MKTIIFSVTKTIKFSVMKILKCIVSLLLVLMLAGCNSKSGNSQDGATDETAKTVAIEFEVPDGIQESEQVIYFPFTTKENGKTSIISVDGKILHADKFNGHVSATVNGYFWVNDNQKYQLYSSTAKPERIGGVYSEVTEFEDGRAIVRESGKPYTIIDGKANIIKTLDKIDGKAPSYFEAFKSGYSIFDIPVNSEDLISLRGAIDRNGNCVIKAVYESLHYMGDNRFLAHDNDKWTIVEAGGRTIKTLPDGIEPLVGGIAFGTVPVEGESKSFHDSYGMIDTNGEFVIPMSEEIFLPEAISPTAYIYKNQHTDKWGIRDFNGNELVFPVYDDRSLMVEDIAERRIPDRVWAVYEDEQGTRTKELIDSQGNSISHRTFTFYGPGWRPFSNHEIVKIDNHEAIIDLITGEIVHEFADDEKVFGH